MIKAYRISKDKLQKIREKDKLNYFDLSEKYKPETIGLKTKTLLVVEAPPPNGKDYFYLPKKLSQYKNIKYARTLPHTIFYHYFNFVPKDEEEYETLLKKLQKKGIFLMDIFDKPIKVSMRGKGINKNACNKIIENIPHLKDKIKNRGINIEDEDIIFLYPGHGYRNELKKEFPNSKIIKWIDFRISLE